MTNGEKMQEVFPEGKIRRCRGGVVFESDGWCHAYDSDWWNAEYKEPRKGHWVDCKCDKCGYVVQPWNTTSFCPNCGSRNEVKA